MTDKSGFDIILEKAGKLITLLFMLVIILPAAFIGYRMFKGILFPGVEQGTVVNVNKETGEEEHLSLGRFYRVQGTALLVAPLSASSGVKDIYYSSSSYGQKIRNYLFYDLDSKTSRWLQDVHSALFLSQHQLLEDLDVQKDGVEERWDRGYKLFKHPDAKIISVVYEAVLSDTNKDGRLDHQDRKAVMFLNLANGDVLTLLEDLEQILGVEQISAEETLIFYSDKQKNYVISIDSRSGEISQTTELLAVGEVQN